MYPRRRRTNWLWAVSLLCAGFSPELAAEEPTPHRAPPPAGENRVPGLATVLQPGDDPADEALPPQPQLGLLARYKDAMGRQVARVEESLSHQWQGGPPEHRLSAGPFEAQWTGSLAITQEGRYRLALWCRGEARLTLNGTEVCQGRSEQGTWLVGPPLELPYGEHQLSVHYHSDTGQGALSLAWTGPQFPLELVPSHVLSHLPDDPAVQLYERGRRLVRALRCAACHEEVPERNASPAHGAPAGPDAVASRRVPAAPDLTRAARSLQASWLLDWLAPAADGGSRATTHLPPREGDMPDDKGALDLVNAPADAGLRPMPEFGLARQQAEALAAYLETLAAEDAAADASPSAAGPEDTGAAGDTAAEYGALDEEAAAVAVGRGRRLFYGLGCLACHSLNGLGHGGPEGGGALDDIGAKRQPQFFVGWLQDPAAWNARHRMPVFDLEPQEIQDLAAFLATLRGEATSRAADARDGGPALPSEAAPRVEDAKARAALVRKGEQLYRRLRCAACHARPAIIDAGPLPIPRTPRWERSCLGEPASDRARPGYRLPGSLRAAIVEYYSQRSDTAFVDSEISGAELLAEQGCLGCHSRGANRGLSEQLPELLEAEPDLVDVAAALTPPSLDGVGDKLHAAWLAQAIWRRGPRLRPWLAVRMPRFRLSEAEVQQLAEWLAAQDRLPAPPPPELEPEPLGQTDAAALQQAGSRLVTADGFGCTSCHQIGSSVPSGVSLAAHGTELSLVGQRVRSSWFLRWVRNPLRLTPRIEMPAIQRPVAGVLDDDLDMQLAAVWHVLNLPAFDPPQPNPIRVVRTHNLPSVDEPALAITDIVELGSAVVPRPLLIGLPNRNNALFDLESVSLTAWWLGDAARQRTRGKSWYWEAGAVPLMQDQAADHPPQPELQLRLGDHTSTWQLERGLTPALDGYAHVPGGLQFDYRLQAAAADAAPAALLRVSQSFTVDANHPTAWLRTVTVSNVPPAAVLRLRVLPAGVQHVRDPSSPLTITGGHSVQLVSPPAEAAWSEGPWVELRGGPDGTRRCILRYVPALAADRYPAPPAATAPARPQPLQEIIPGWRAVRLPLPPEDMITCLGWRADGSLVYASLKGNVRVARDTDGDGWEDACLTVADGLPAPYGLATPEHAGEPWIDVLCKYGLVRLWLDESDRLQRAEVVASGWGWSADYHDWAVGLPRDADGAYYVALPCQQDERPHSAARLRGTALRLVPRQPTDDDPRRFRIEPICSGLRFPMGLARDAQGRLFATDNQGNYNPFNELNHLQPGRHYGFVNRLAEHLPRPPLETAAIEIPHPWTRSVNGVCFLYGPPNTAGFGPFEGHLVGCEYDTRRLIRMSLQEVRGVVQGAAYPFSLDPPPDAGLEGPVACAISPQGELYVGNLRDSGWGGGRNTGSLVRLQPTPAVPPGIREVQARSHGLEVTFTCPVDPALASDADRYHVLCYRRASTPEYGGPNLDEQTCRVQVAAVAADGLGVRLAISPWKAGFVYELRVSGLVPAGQRFFPAEAYYTLKAVP